MNKNEPDVRRICGQSCHSTGSLSYVDVDPGESRGDHLESRWNVGISSVVDPAQCSGAIFPSNDCFLLQDDEFWRRVGR
jgi:hypothetical protein